MLASREQINEYIRVILDRGTDPWGTEVTGVEVKDIDLPQEMKRAMAKQAEAERERRAKVIAADGEYQASTKLAQAADVMRDHPVALQFRYLQTVAEIATENNSTTLFPIPIELFAGLTEKQTVVPRGGFPDPAEADEAVPAGKPLLESGSEAARAVELAKRALGLASAREKAPATPDDEGR